MRAFSLVCPLSRASPLLGLASALDPDSKLKKEEEEEELRFKSRCQGAVRMPNCGRWRERELHALARCSAPEELLWASGIQWLLGPYEVAWMCGPDLDLGSPAAGGAAGTVA